MKRQPRIICASPPRTASTVLNNCILGLFRPHHPVVILDDNTIEENLITVTHNTDIDSLTKKYSDKYKLTFFCSERKDLNRFIDPKYHMYKNVFIFQFEDLNETQDYSLEDIVSKIEFAIAPDKLNKNLAIQRLEKMNEYYEKIKHLDFSQHDGFFHLHGGHRNRKD